MAAGMKYSWLLLLGLVSVGASVHLDCSARTAPVRQRTLNITLACAADNDLFVALTGSGYRCRRYDTAVEAFEAAPKDSAVLVMAEAYPPDISAPESRTLARAFARRLRLYIEHPSV